MINIAQFNWLDYVFAILILLSVILGLKQGFLKGLISLLVWFAVLFIPLLFTNSVAFYVMKVIHSSSWAHFFSFVVLALATLIIGSILYNLIRLIAGSDVNFIAALFGAVFGFVRGVLIVVLFVAMFSPLNFYQYQWFAQSQLVNVTQNILSNIQQHADKTTKKLRKKMR